VLAVCKSGVVDNIGVATGISLISQFGPKIQCTSGLQAAILISGCRLTLGNDGSMTIE
jgi:hypothetical protein